MQFGLHGERDLEGQRGEGLHEQLTHGGVHGAAGDALAGLVGVLDAVPIAVVVGDLMAAAGVVAHGHPVAAAAADGQSLQQGGALPGRAGGAVGAVGAGVVGEGALVGVELLEGDVAGVGVRDEHEPLLAGLDGGGLLPVRGALLAASAVGESACVAGVVQDVQDPGVGQRHPQQLALAGSAVHPDREQQSAGVEFGDRGPGGAGAGEDGEHVPQRVLHAGVRVQHDFAGRVVDQADGQGHGQFAAAGLGQLSAAEPGPDEVQFGLAHGALQPEQQPVVEIAGVVDAVLVADQCAGQGADLQQPVPVGVVPGQPGNLQAQHDAGVAHADLGDQPLEPFPVGGRRPGLALVGVDGDDLFGRPAQGDRPSAATRIAGWPIRCWSAPAAAWTAARRGTRSGSGGCW